MLGATYFANTYQFTNSLPNLIFYGLLAGSMFSSLLVPALVDHIDSGTGSGKRSHRGRAARVAMLGMLAIVPVAAVATPWLLRLGSVGAANPAAADSQVHVGAVLVAALAAAGAAVRGRGHGDGGHERPPPLRAAGGRARPGESGHDRRPRGGGRPLFPGGHEHAVPLSLLLLLGLGTTGAVTAACERAVVGRPAGRRRPRAERRLA